MLSAILEAVLVTHQTPSLLALWPWPRPQNWGAHCCSLPGHISGVLSTAAQQTRTRTCPVSPMADLSLGICMTPIFLGTVTSCLCLITPDWNKLPVFSLFQRVLLTQGSTSVTAGLASCSGPNEGWTGQAEEEGPFLADGGL